MTTPVIIQDTFIRSNSSTITATFSSGPTQNNWILAVITGYANTISYGTYTPVVQKINTPQTYQALTIYAIPVISSNTITQPTIIQHVASNSTSGNALYTLSSTPTVGNTLVCIFSHYHDSYGLASGWTEYQNSNASIIDLAIVYHTVVAGDSTSWTPATNMQGGSGELLEISNFNTANISFSNILVNQNASPSLTFTATSTTIGQNNLVIVVATSMTGGYTTTFDSNWTALDTTTDSSKQAASSAYRNVSLGNTTITGVATYSGTITSSAAALGIISLSSVPISSCQYIFTGATDMQNISLFEIQNYGSIIYTYGAGTATGSTLATGSLPVATYSDCIRMLAIEWDNTIVSTSAPSDYTLLSPSSWYSDSNTHKGGIYSISNTDSGIQTFGMSGTATYPIWTDIQVYSESVENIIISEVNSEVWGTNISPQINISEMNAEVWIDRSRIYVPSLTGNYFSSVIIIN